MKKKNKEPPVRDNSVINVPIHFKLFKCGKNFFNKIYATCERECMATLKGKYELELLKYQ